MTNNLNTTFAALSDPTRRAVVETLMTAPAPVSDLHAPHNMALPTFLKHLKVLEEAGLVRSEKKGRVRTVSLNPEPLKAVETWMTGHRDMWEARLDRLEQLANDMERTTS